MLTTEERQRSPLLKKLHIDGPLLIPLVLLSVLSLFVIYSAAGQDLEVVERQSIRIGLSFVVLFVVAQIPPRALSRFAVPAVFHSIHRARAHY